MNIYRCKPQTSAVCQNVMGTCQKIAIKMSFKPGLEPNSQEVGTFESINNDKTS